MKKKPIKKIAIKKNLENNRLKFEFQEIQIDFRKIFSRCSYSISNLLSPV